MKNISYILILLFVYGCNLFESSYEERYDKIQSKYNEMIQEFTNNDSIDYIRIKYYCTYSKSDYWDFFQTKGENLFFSLSSNDLSIKKLRCSRTTFQKSYNLLECVEPPDTTTTKMSISHSCFLEVELRIKNIKKEFTYDMVFDNKNRLGFKFCEKQMVDLLIKEIFMTELHNEGLEQDNN